MPPWHSEIFKGTTRDWWVYVPAQYRADDPAAVMIFQDGNGPRTWVPVVFDNLIARGDMPITVGVFVEPGGRSAPRDNRSVEYDTLSDQYARFLLEEILPEVDKTVKLKRDGASRAMDGQSSGGRGGLLPLDDVRAALVREIDAAGADALVSLRLRLAADNGWTYYPPDPLARRIHHLLADRFLERDSIVAGLEHLETCAPGPRLMVANHLSYADANVVDVLLQRAGAGAIASRLAAIAGPKVFTSRD